MRRLTVPAIAALLTVAAMAFQAKTVVPVLCEPPAVELPEIAGFESRIQPPGEAELNVLPADTVIMKRVYTDKQGHWSLVSAIVGGKSKSSIHRPELCLPAQGYQMQRPRKIEIGGVEWRMVTLASRQDPEVNFAYTFFNQDGYGTSSHLKRIFRDVLDRSLHGRIDRWVMVTVASSVTDDGRFAEFLALLKQEGVL